MACDHRTVECINPYELIRKYRCADCRGIMMCACDEGFGRRFLSHQLEEGTELQTRKRVKVTRGFQKNLCNECRGLPPLNAPVAEIYGRATKIKRYYWRELYFEQTRRKADWENQNPTADDIQRIEEFKRIEQNVLSEIKAMHEKEPKYAFLDDSQSTVLEKFNVKVVHLYPEYADSSAKGALIQVGSEVVSAEDFVARHYEAQGWKVMKLESSPMHALFGVMMWLVIQDIGDSKCRLAGFGNRDAFEQGVESAVIWTHLPEDFGCPGYGHRRRVAIRKHFEMVQPDRRELLYLFDYWQCPSHNFCQYLWGHREVDINRARRLIEILPPEHIISILQYLVDDYWGRYLGWPDLLMHRDEEILFAEVKSSTDKLSQDQKKWIAGNYERLKFQFCLVKLHRRKQDVLSGVLRDGMS